MRVPSMATMREELWECAMWGYFAIKATFLRRGWATPSDAPALPHDLFYQVHAAYCKFCRIALEEHPGVMPKRRKLARYVQWAVQVAGTVFPPGNTVEKKPEIAPEDSQCLKGGYLVIERALLVLGILGQAFKGFQLYATCCLQFHEWQRKIRLRISARATIAKALQVVATGTGRDPCDPVNWAGPDDADWEKVMQLSWKLWALFGTRYDPLNSLHRKPGDTA